MRAPSRANLLTRPGLALSAADASNTTEQNAADYMAGWVGGVKAAHNLTIDWVGM